MSFHDKNSDDNEMSFAEAYASIKAALLERGITFAKFYIIVASPSPSRMKPKHQDDIKAIIAVGS